MHNLYRAYGPSLYRGKGFFLHDLFLKEISLLLFWKMPPQQPQAPRNEIVEWYNSIPPITKAIFTLSLATTVAPTFGLLSPFSLILDWSAVSKLQVNVTLCIMVPVVNVLHETDMETGYAILSEPARACVCDELVLHLPLFLATGE